MKKFISFVMAAAMVASLVPATAFAASDEIKGNVRVINAWDRKAGNTNFTGDVTGNDVPEVQIRITDVDYLRTSGKAPKATVTLTLDNAKFKDFDYATESDSNEDIVIRDSDGAVLTAGTVTPGASTYSYTEITGSAIEAAMKAISEGATNYGYVLTTTWNAYTGNASIGGTTVTKASVDAVAFSTTKGDAILTDLETNKANFNIITDTATSTYAYNDATDTLVRKAIGTEGPATISSAEFEAVTGHPFSYYEQTGNFTLAAAQVASGGSIVDTDTNTFYRETEKAGSVTAGGSGTARVAVCDIAYGRNGDDEVEITFEGWFDDGDVISINLPSEMKNAIKNAVVSVTSDDMTLSNDGADIIYVNVLDEGIKLSVKKLVDVAEEEKTELNDKGLKIESAVEGFNNGDDITLKLSKGFEFVERSINYAGAGTHWSVVAKDADGNPKSASVEYIDANELTVHVTSNDVTEITIKGIEVEAASAKSGSTATIKATCKGYDSASVEVAKVVDYKVVLSVDEDEDLPVIYSGVDVDNTGITDDSDHWSVEVTAEETFPGAWSFRKGFNFELPEGVYVTDVEVKGVEGFLRTTNAGSGAQGNADEVRKGHVDKAFFDAYQDGNHANFEFEKRVFDDVDSILNEDKASMTFKLQLVADPGYVGDVVLKLTGELVDDQEVAIAKFVAPYEVKAEQNDMIIDYRYTDVPTAITITEAEGGLWDENARFDFYIEKDLIAFEGDPTFEIDSKSDLEIKKDEADDGKVTFTVKDESDEAATVTIKDMQLFMQRNIPAGPYKLKIASSLAEAYDRQMLFAADHQSCTVDGVISPDPLEAGHNGGYDSDAHDRTDKDCWVGDVCDYNTTVKEAFINVITAGRDVDDASFTTKVVVPVGESYMVAGEKQIELDVPAYINAAGYTMLPIRAVATALGISNNNVLWDQPTKTVTILYGQRIITMTQGQKVVYVNGSAIPASAAVENTNSRTFLPMRDLATALGVTDITWDQATRTATLNGNQK